VNHLDVLAAESAAFLTAVTGNLGAPVPSCPEWTVSDLVAYLGRVQRFHTRHVVRGVTDDPDRETPIEPPADDDLLPWFEESTRVLLATLREVGTQTPAWSFGPPRTSAFWHRRMALEAAIHRWDAQSARHDAHGFEVAVAVDGIDEVLTVHTPSDLQDEPVEVRGVVQVRLTDSDRTWTVEHLGDDLVTTQKTPEAVLEGTASGVFLALWGRVPLSSLTVEGDETLVAALRTG
jgi:uncharacterized protein (TIGR03083 family)